MWKGAKIGFEWGQERVWNGVKNGLERGQKLVLNGKKNRISPNSTIWNGVERPFFAVPHLSTIFLPFQPFFHPSLTIFAKKGKKRSSKNGGTGMENNALLSSFFPVSFFSLSFPRTFLMRNYHWGASTRHKRDALDLVNCPTIPGAQRTGFT